VSNGRASWSCKNVRAKRACTRWQTTGRGNERSLRVADREDEESGGGSGAGERRTWAGAVTLMDERVKQGLMEERVVSRDERGEARCVTADVTR
jgi:hypothetical protein